MSDRLFDVDEIPEVPLFRPPRRPRGATDARFQNDYPPEWTRCQTCGGGGRLWGDPDPGFPEIGDGEIVQLVWNLTGRDHALSRHVKGPGGVAEVLEDPGMVGEFAGIMRRDVPCPDCLGMGSLKARVRLEAGHRCVRCHHPYMPKDDAAMLGVKRSGMVTVIEKGTSVGLTSVMLSQMREVWEPWSACDELCTHGPIFRVSSPSVVAHEVEQPAWRDPSSYLLDGMKVEAFWRILTVHHLDGDKANCRWWNLASLCQRCHLEIQAKVVMERVYPHEHSEWFKPYVAGYYAFVYQGLELSRDEVMGRLDALLALERA